MARPLCIYHGGCDDGFAAAFVAHLAFSGEIDFHYGVYQAAPPEVEGRDVILLDFTYQRPVLEKMAMQARTILILDHHKSAAEDLAGLPPPLDGPYDADRMARECSGPAVHALFDMERSGAGIAWDFFFPSKPRPWLIDYIEDRDLWRRRLPDSDYIIMALRSYPQDFAVWDVILARGAASLRNEGRAIHRYYRTIIDALKQNAVVGSIGGYTVPIVNAPHHFASELAGELAEGVPFAACYWNHAHGTTYSLRSRDDGIDVSEVAKQYGGGGHRGAAGFKAPAPVHEKG